MAKNVAAKSWARSSPTGIFQSNPSVITPGTPAFYQNFDGLTVGAQSGFNSFDFTTVSNVWSASGAHSAISTVAAGGSNFGGGQALAVQPSLGDEVWFRCHLMFPVGFNFQAPGNGHLKFMRIDTGTPGSTTHAHLDLYLANGGLNDPGYFDWIYEATQSWMFGGSPTTPVPTGITLGVGNVFEVYYKLGLTPATSIIRLWRDGTLLIDTSINLPAGLVPQSTLSAANFIAGASAQDSGGGGGYMWSTFWNGNSPQTQSGYCDDFTVFTSLTGRPTKTDANGNTFIGDWTP